MRTLTGFSATAILAAISLLSSATAREECPRTGCPRPQPVQQVERPQPVQSPQGYRPPQYPQNQGYRPTPAPPTNPLFNLFRPPQNTPNRNPYIQRPPNSYPARTQVPNPYQPTFTARGGAIAPTPIGQGVPRTIRLDRTTQILDHGYGQGVTIVRSNKGGSQLIAHERMLPDGTRQVEAYRESKSRATGATTRDYVDGRHYVVGRNFETFSAPGRLTLTQRSDGTREAMLPNGRYVYREQIQSVRDSNGQQQRVLVRTVYMQVYGGRAIALARPVTQTYNVVVFQGETVYTYVPAPQPDAFYVAFAEPLPPNFALATNCPDCVPPGVTFESGFLSGLFGGGSDTYSDPSDVLGDMQAAEGYEDATGGGGDDVSAGNAAVDTNSAAVDVAQAPAPAADPSLQSQTAALQQQLDSAQGTVSQSSPTESELVTTNPDASEPGQANKASAKPEVPKHIRKQVRQQVKDAIAAQKAHKSLSVVDVLASAQATNYAFRVSSALIVDDAATQAKCVLHTNDYIKVSALPQDTDKTVRMQVDTASKTSCHQNSVVLVGRSNLQDMLNDFSQKLEHNMQIVAANMAKGAPKQNSTSG